jgi:hypothetical protein
LKSRRGQAPPANLRRFRMLTVLLFLWVIVVVFDLKVKIVIERP